MIYQRENGSCTGKGFANTNVNGFLAKFKTWVQNTYPSGPGWTIIEDQSQDPGQGKWGKVSTATGGVGSNFDTLAEIAAITNGSFRITIGATTANVTGITFSGIATWDDVAARIQTAIRAASVNPEFTGAVCGHFMSRVNDPADLRHRFTIIAGIRGVNVSYLSTSTVSVGTDLSGWTYLIMLSGGGVLDSGTTQPFIVVCSSSTPSWDDNPPNKYIEIGSDGTAGMIYITVWWNWDTTLHLGLGQWSHNHITTEDDIEFIYDFRGGNEMMIIQSFKGSVWYTFLMDNWVGDPILVEGTSVRGVTTGAVTTAMNSVTLGSGQGSLFKENNFYFLIDLNKSECVQYMKIATGGISGDTITFTGNFVMEAKAGAILSPYYHRFYATSTGSQANSRGRLPYISHQRRELLLGDQWSDLNGCTGEIMYNYLIYMAPTDTGSYACMKPGIVEEQGGNISAVYTNRAYGSMKNIYVCSSTGMSPATDGKTINSKNFLYFKLHNELFNRGAQYGNLSILFPDYNENT